jgi:hypothetical protein
MGVLSNVFGGTTGQFSGGPGAVSAAQLSDEGFTLAKPFIQDILEASRAQFFEDTTDPETGETIQQLAPFEQFTGPRIASFAPEQEEAFSGLASLGREGIASSEFGKSTPYFESAVGSLNLGTLPFTETAAQELMNPYLRQVTDTAKREAIRQYESAIQPKLDAAAVQAGSFGGSRAAILEAEAQRNLQNQLSEIEERGLTTSYEQALKAFEAQKARELQGSALYSALGEAAPAQAARELAFLSTVGENKQAQEQAALNLAERDFLEQREFPLRQLQEFQSLVRGFPFTPSSYQVTTKQEPQASFGQQLLGTLGTGLGIFGALGGFKNKAGGQVVPRQSGGQIRGGLSSLERHQNNVNPTMGRTVTREDLNRPAQFGGIIPILSDAISSILTPRSTPPGMVPQYTNQRASDLQPVVRVGEPVPGSLSETSALVEAIQPKEKSISDYINMITNQIPDRKTIEAGSRILTGRTEQFTEEDDKVVGFELDKGPLSRRIIEKFVPSDPFPQGSEEPKRDLMLQPWYLNSNPFIESNGKDAAVKKAASPIPKGESEKQTDDGRKGASSVTPFAPPFAPPPAPPAEDSYGKVDKAFDDYLSFLEKKKSTADERLTEAEESKEVQLFAELAAASARFAGEKGPAGFLAKLNKAALPSIENLKEIQKDFRKESRAAKDIEEEVLKEGLNINLAREKLNLERSKIASENDLRAAKAQAERMANRYGLDANEAYDKLVKSINDLTIAPFQKVEVYNRFTNLLNEGVNPTSAVNAANDFALSLAKTGSRRDKEAGTTQAALNDAQQAAKKKLDAARRNPSN